MPTRSHVPAHMASAEPKLLSQLSRVQLAGRIHVLRGALDLLWSQADGCEPFTTIGRAKAELLDLEERLWEMDHPKVPRPAPLPLEVALAMVVQGGIR